jgi:hypothetical protein
LSPKSGCSKRRGRLRIRPRPISQPQSPTREIPGACGGWTVPSQATDSNDVLLCSSYPETYPPIALPESYSMPGSVGKGKAESCGGASGGRARFELSECNPVSLTRRGLRPNPKPESRNPREKGNLETARTQSLRQFRGFVSHFEF